MSHLTLSDLIRGTDFSPDPKSLWALFCFYLDCVFLFFKFLPNQKICVWNCCFLTRQKMMFLGKVCSHRNLQMKIASKQKSRTQRPARSMRQKKGRCVSNFENHKYLQYFFYKKCMILFKNKLWKGKVWWYQHRNSKRRLQKYLFY